MNYEEKYKEVFKRAEAIIRFYKNQNRDDETSIKDLELIFPELKESEGEKVRKEIIAVFKGEISYTSEEDAQKYIAWLEKQENRIKLSDSAYTSNRDVIEFADKYSYTVWEKLMDKFKKNENYSIGCNDVSDIVLNAIINTYNWLEKQDKQKPVISDDALREGIAHFGITQYQIDNWLKKYIDVENQDEQKASYTTKVKTGDGGINALVTRELSTDDVDKIVGMDLEDYL